MSRLACAVVSIAAALASAVMSIRPAAAAAATAPYPTASSAAVVAYTAAPAEAPIDRPPAPRPAQIGSLTALDWRSPWKEPQDPAAAAARSDEYAWALFVALNWPLDAAHERADAAAKLGADRDVVWQGWAGARDIFRDDGGDPGPWSARGELPPDRRFETVSSRELPNLRHIVDGRMVPVTDAIGSARRLTEIRLNRTSFELIRSQNLYNLEGQQRAYAAGRDVEFPPGAREVKAKWKPIEDGERLRYHAMALTLPDGHRQWYGLTALHVASKDLPHWFWATFEHVDNPKLPDNEGWQLPSRDRFACGDAPPDCNRAPSGIGLEGTAWSFYRLRGTLSAYTDAQGAPLRLANSELESGMQASASCITCHSRAAIVMKDGRLAHREIFDVSDHTPSGPLERHGFIGAPTWLDPRDSPDAYRTLDFVWSLTLARHESHAAADPILGQPGKRGFP